MNIKDYKNAYSGIRATGSLKQRVMDSAAQEEKKRSPGKKPLFLPIAGGIAGAAAVFALIIAGGNLLRSMFSDKFGIVVTASERPALTDAGIFYPVYGSTGELRSPKVRSETDMPGSVYDIMPAIPDTEALRYRSAFSEKFTTFVPELVEYVGNKEFSDWEDMIWQRRNETYGETFYNRMTLLAYARYFDISGEEITRLLSGSSFYGFNNDEIKAIAGRDEELCRRLFVNSEVPLITNGDGGYAFYTVMSLYEMPPRQLAELLRSAGDMQGETLLALAEWSYFQGNDTVIKAVERKNLIVQSYLYTSSKPTLAENDVLDRFFDRKYSDFSEYLEIDGCVIFNYVRRLVEQSVTDEYLLDVALNGGVGDGPGVIASYNRLTILKDADGAQLISPEMLMEALQMIDLHYYGQTGSHLYDDSELIAIAYGSQDAFISDFVQPSVFVSRENALGLLWKTPAEIYNLSAADWLGYLDLTDEYLDFVQKQLDGQAAEYFRQQVKFYREIRCLTAAYLDGGEMAKDNGLLCVPAPDDDITEGEANIPALSEELRGRLSELSFGLRDDGTLTMSGTEIYYASLTGLAELNVAGSRLKDAIQEIISVCKPGDPYKSSLTVKMYLYLWHTGDANLYNREYLKSVFSAADCKYKTDGSKILITSGLTDSLRKWLERYHLCEIAKSERDLEVERSRADMAAVLLIPREMMLNAETNPILPEAGARGLFMCAFYGYDKWLETLHYGLDFAPAEGDIVAAFGDGTVSFAGEKGSSGLCVVIDHGEDVQTVYSHCSELYVREGQQVSGGEYIAAVGSSGYSTGPHLHFELLIGGETVDPAVYLERAE